MSHASVDAEISRLAERALLADEEYERQMQAVRRQQPDESKLVEAARLREQAHEALDRVRSAEERRLQRELAQRAYDCAVKELEAHRAVVLGAREQLADLQRRLPELETGLGIKMRTWANCKLALQAAGA